MARRLAAQHGLSLLDDDVLFDGDLWRRKDEVRRLTREHVESSDAWVVATSSGVMLRVALPLASRVVWLDLPHEEVVVAVLRREGVRNAVALWEERNGREIQEAVEAQLVSYDNVERVRSYDDLNARYFERGTT